MQKSKVGLDFNQVEHARDVAKRIAGQVQRFNVAFRKLMGMTPMEYRKLHLK